MWVQFKDGIQSALTKEKKIKVNGFGTKWYKVPKGFNPKTQYLTLINEIPKIAAQSLKEKKIEEKQKRLALKPINEIMDLYSQRERDGKLAFNKFRAELVLNINNEKLSILDVIEIENELETVINRIRTGDWYSAQVALSKTSPLNNAQQNVFRSVKKIIGAYVSKNYK